MAPKIDSVMLHDHLLAKGRETPGHIAVVCREVEWTYRQLEQRATSYAAGLRLLGVARLDRVVFVLDPCPEAVALIIACSMIGAVFVPLSPEMPEERVRGVIETVCPALVIRRDSGARLLVSGARGESVLSPDGGGGEACNPRLTDSHPDQLAYVIFTSGTTGRPKGIMTSHRAAISFFRGFGRYGVSGGDRIGSVAPLQFDFSLCDMGVTLGSGGTLVQVPRLLVHKHDAFVDYLVRKQVTIMHAVPSVWNALLADRPERLHRLTQLRALMYAGESFATHRLRVLEDHLPGVRIIQGFGHSESIGCAFKLLPRPFTHIDGKIPVGWAIDGMEMFILDEDMREIMAPRVIGELYLKGPALFSGYWNDAALTAAALLADPRPGVEAGLVFKSGDRVFRDEEGDFYVCGRVDLMLKVDGYRVEIEEIEAVLAGHPLVAEAALAGRPEDGRWRLVAYIVPVSERSAPPEVDLRSHCAQALPGYMQPSEYRFVSALPSTLNGKLDRPRLGEMAAA